MNLLPANKPLSLSKFFRRPRWVEIILVISALIVFIALFFIFYPTQGAGMAALVVLPVALTGWVWGLRAGMLAGLLSIPLITLLLILIGEAGGGLDVLLKTQNGPMMFSVVVVGLVVGYLRELYLQVSREQTEPEQAEKRLQASENFLRLIIQTQPECVKLVAPDGTLMDMNPAGVQMIEADTLEQIQGQSVIELVAPENRTAYQRLHRQVMRGESGRLEFEIIGLRGTHRWLEMHAVPLRNDQQEIIALLGMTRDITNRKYSEESLRVAERRYRELVEQMPAVIYSAELGPQGRWFYASPQIEALTGFPPEDWLANPDLWFSLLHPDDQKYAQEVETQVQTVGGTLDYEYRLMTRDGQTIWVRDKGTITRNEDQTNYISLGFLTNITEKKQAELALKQAEEKYRSLVENLPGVVYQDALNEVASTQFVSSRVESMLGYKPKEWLTDPEFWVKLLHPEDRERALEANLQHNTIGKPFEMEYRLVASDGSTVWVRDRAVVVRDETGNPESSQGIMIDITEQKRGETEREALTQIMKAAIASTDTREFLELVHQSIRQVIYAENFFVARYSKKTGLFEAIYSVDQYDHPPGPIELGKSISAYVFRTGQPLLLTQEQFDVLLAKGEVELIGTNSPSWLGVPLKTPTETIGVMVVQHYEESDCYSEDDIAFLTFIAGQVALVVENKQVEDDLRQFREVIDESNDAIFLIDPITSQYIDFNKNALQYLGYSHEELRQVGVIQIAQHIPDMEVWCERVRLVEEEGGLIFETIYQRKDGTQFPVEVSARMLDYGKDYVMVAIVRDITERKKTEEDLRTREQQYRELYATAQRQAQELALLDKVRATVVQEMELPVLLRAVVESIAETFGYTLVSLYLLEEETLFLQHQVGYHQVITRVLISDGMMGRVARTGQPVFLEDVRADSAFLGAIEGIVSEVCVPLFDEGRVVGVLNVESTQDVHLTAADLSLMMALSEQIGIAIDRGRLYSNIQHNNQILAALQEATLPLMKQLELSEVLQAILTQAGGLLNALHAYVYLVNPDQTSLDMVFGIGAFSDYRGNQLLPGEGLAGKVWQSAEALNVTNYQTWAGHSSQFQGTPFHAVVGVPLFSSDNVMGVLGLARLNPDQAFSDEEVDLLLRFAHLASIALENARLYTLSQQELEERKRAEAALLSSQERLQTTMDSMLEGAQIIGPDWRYIYVNDAVVVQAQQSREELLGHTMMERYPGIEHTELFEVLRHCIKMRTSKHMENEFTFPSGSKGWFELSIQPISEGLFILSQDITERKRAEEALRESEVRFRSLVEAATEAIIQADSNGLITGWNQGARTIFGYEADEVLGHPLTILMPTSYHRAHQTGLARVLSGGEEHVIGQTVEMEGRRKDGSKFPVSISLSTWTVGDDHFFSGILRDISERKRFEEELKRRADEFAGLFEITHDLAIQWDLPRLLEAVASQAMKLLQAGGVGIYLYDAVHGDLPVAIDKGPGFLPGVRLALGEGLAGYVGQTRQPLKLEDYQSWEGRSPQYEGVPIRATAAVPLLYRGELIGVLVVEELGDSQRRFTDEDVRFLSLLAAQAASAVHNARLFENTSRRLAELEAVSRISTALRVAQSLEEMLPILLEETLAILNTDAGSIWLYYPASNNLGRAVARGWFASLPNLKLKPGEGISGRVFMTEQIYQVQDFIKDPLALTTMLPHYPPGWGAVCVPIRTAQESVGVLCVGLQHPRGLTESEIQLLTTLAEIAGNAIHRTRLNEETQANLRLLAALHIIDQAITSSFDLKITLNVLINQAIVHLGADAVAILRFNLNNLMLEYAAGRGFYSTRVTQTRLRLGEAYAGQVVLERRPIYIPDLSASDQAAKDPELISSEAFLAYHAIPLIVKGQIKGVLEAYYRKSFAPTTNWLNFFETLAGQAAIAIDNGELFDGLQRSNQELIQAYNATIEGWSRVLDLRDKETEGHSQRVTEMTLKLAKEMGVSESEMVHIRRGSLLHDIGKMGIPDHILLKSGPLTDEEWEFMRRHPMYAYEMLSQIEYLRPALDIPYCHHEKWDGTGYPRRLKGEQIPLAARIFAVVDVWDALSSDRPYREAWPVEKVCAHFREHAGKHFDPKVVEIFLQMLE